MSSILHLLPLLLIILIVIGILVWNGRISRKPMTYQKMKWIFISYIFMLLLGVIFSPILPTSWAKQPEYNDVNDFDNFQESLYMKAMERGISGLNKEEVKNKWDFSYTEDMVFIDSFHFDGGAIVEETNELQNNIEVFFIKDYEIMRAGSAMIDVGEYTPDMAVELESNRLLLKGPDDKPRISLAITEPEFPITQFTNRNEESIFGYHGSHFFYIRIPKGIHVSYADDIFVDFVKN